MRLYHLKAGEIEVHVCGYCNRKTEDFFVLADSPTEALQWIKEIIKEGKAPLCGQCMCELLHAGNYRIA